jgi:RNA-directed DNA polymerase
VRRHRIPKSGGKARCLGIPNIRDRVVQMALKLIPEPIEADFATTSTRFGQNIRAQAAFAEVYHLVQAPSN